MQLMVLYYKVCWYYFTRFINKLRNIGEFLDLYNKTLFAIKTSEYRISS